MSVIFFPDAFFRLTGIRPADIRDRVVPAEALCNDALLIHFEDVLETGSPEAGFELLLALIGSERSLVLTGAGAVASLADWSRSLAVRIAESGTGSSMRQIERRFRTWTGQTKRDLDHHVRLEQAFYAAMDAARLGNLDASGIAHENGFSDQSHMGRNVRRHTGHSPVDLMQRIETEESYWSYRAIGAAGLA